MKLETAIKKAKEKSGDNKELLRLKLFSIGLRYFRAYCNPVFQKEWTAVNN